jgi:hypothetical protein
MARKRVDANPDLHKEQAEGDRETVEEALRHAEREPHQGHEVPARERQGLTNRPLGEEEDEQRKLPPRGEAKKPTPGGHA